MRLKAPSASSRHCAQYRSRSTERCREAEALAHRCGEPPDPQAPSSTALTGRAAPRPASAERIDGLEWIRMLYLYPRHRRCRADAMPKSKGCKYIDLPLQHSSMRC